MIEFKLETANAGAEGAPAVSIIGIGGAGANVLDHIALEGMDGVELISMNCDVRSLTSSMAQRKVQLGKSLTQGLGCGGDPELGQEAAASSIEDIREALSGRRMIFVCVGLGGGTGSGAAPMVTRLARETGAFVIVFATMPFVFEGKRRMQQAQTALSEIRGYANALVCFENDKMGELVLPKKGVTEAFEVADKIICQSVRAVTTVATQPGLIRIGMDDLVTALKNADSRCLFGFGQAKGEARATEALQQALKSPLLDRGQLLEKARNVLVHICGGINLTLFEIETLMRELTKHVSEDAQILFGAASDNKLADSLSVTIISSLGNVKAAPPVAAAQIPAPAPQPLRPVPLPVTQHTGSVPILSVQPRQVPQPPPASQVAPPAFTMTGATSSVPVLKLSAQIEPTRPVKPVKEAPLTPPVAEPDLFAAPPEAPSSPEPVMVMEETVPVVVVEEAPVAEEVVAVPVMEEIAAPVVEETPEPVIEEVVMAVAEEEEVPQVEEPEEVVAQEEEEVVEEVEMEEEIVAQEETVEEPVLQKEEEEIAFDESEEDEPPAALVPEPRPVAPMRPIEIQQPVAKAPPAARKFDLREILQRQRQTRLGQQGRTAPMPQRPAPAEPVVERSAPAPSRPPIPPRPVPVADRTPDPTRVAPIRPIPPVQPAVQPPARAVSPFSPTKPPPTPVTAPVQVPVGRASGQQVTFDERLTPTARGSRFEKTEPTYDEEGGDLDVPTFLRKKR
jgi:cell division protein FtsZ